MTDTDLMDTTLDFRHSVSAHAPATVKNCQADGLADRRRVLRLRKPCKPLHPPASGESDLSAAATLTPPEKGAQDLHSPPDCSLRPSASRTADSPARCAMMIWLVARGTQLVRSNQI